MAGEAELEGRLLTVEAWRMVVKRYEFIARHARGKRLLDVGCGGGLGLGYLREAGVGMVVATDLSGENVAAAARLAGEAAHYARMDAHAMCFPAASFDVISAMQVIQYLDLERFLTEAHRVLVPGGRLVVSIPNVSRRDGFEESRFSRGYPTGQHLVDAMCSSGLAAELYGLFPLRDTELTRGVAVTSKVRRLILKCILAVPGGEAVKDALVRRCLSRVEVHAVTSLEVEDVREVAEESLSHIEPAWDHKILYVVGEKLSS